MNRHVYIHSANDVSFRTEIDPVIAVKYFGIQVPEHCRPALTAIYNTVIKDINTDFVLVPSKSDRGKMIVRFACDTDNLNINEVSATIRKLNDEATQDDDNPEMDINLLYCRVMDTIDVLHHIAYARFGEKGSSIRLVARCKNAINRDVWGLTDIKHVNAPKQTPININIKKWSVTNNIDYFVPVENRRSAFMYLQENVLQIDETVFMVGNQVMWTVPNAKVIRINAENFMLHYEVLAMYKKVVGPYNTNRGIPVSTSLSTLEIALKTFIDSMYKMYKYVVATTPMEMKANEPSRNDLQIMPELDNYLGRPYTGPAPLMLNSDDFVARSPSVSPQTSPRMRLAQLPPHHGHLLHQPTIGDSTSRHVHFMFQFPMAFKVPGITSDAVFMMSSNKQVLVDNNDGFTHALVHGLFTGLRLHRLSRSTVVKNAPPVDSWTSDAHNSAWLWSKQM